MGRRVQSALLVLALLLSVAVLAPTALADKGPAPNEFGQNAYSYIEALTRVENPDGTYTKLLRQAGTEFANCRGELHRIDRTPVRNRADGRDERIVHPDAELALLAVDGDRLRQRNIDLSGRRVTRLRSLQQHLHAAGAGLIEFDGQYAAPIDLSH